MMANTGSASNDANIFQNTSNNDIPECDIGFFINKEQHTESVTAKYHLEPGGEMSSDTRCSDKEFFDSLICAFGPPATESEPRFLDYLTTNFTGMDRKEVCEKLLELAENALQTASSGDSVVTSTFVQESLVKLNEFLTSQLRLMSGENSMKCGHTSESTPSSVNQNSSITSDSSLGILDISSLSSISNDSFEGFGGQSSYQQGDVTEFLQEIVELQHQNKKLVEENLTMKTQISTSDELNQLLIQENGKLRNGIKSLQENVKEMHELQLKDDALKLCLLNAEKMQKNLTSKLDELEKEKESLEENLKVLGEKLILSQSNAEQKEKQLQNLNQSLSVQKSAVEQILYSKNKVEAQLKESQIKYNDLELSLKELTDANQSLRQDKNAIECELKKTKDSLDSILLNYSWYSGVHYYSSPGHFPNSISTSTPSGNLEVKPSLCSEMTNAASQSEGLPMPFCGKVLTVRNGKLLSVNTSIQQRKKGSGVLSLPLHKRWCHTSTMSHIHWKKYSKQRGSKYHSHNRSVKTNGTSVGTPLKNSISSNRKKLFHLEANSRSCGAVESNFTESLSEFTSFLEFVCKELHCQRKYLTQINSQANEALKIDLDVLELEKALLEGKEESSVELKIDSKAAGDSGMPPQAYNVAVSEHSNNKPISDLTTNDIKEQISAEIKALKTQIVRSHALLTYLQETEKYSSVSCSPCLFNQKVADGQHGRGKLQLQKSLDIQATTCCHHYSHKDSISSVSHRSTPLHHYHRAQSCPTFLADIPFLSKSTQTETSYSQVNDQSSISSLQQNQVQRYVPVLNRGKDSKFSECSSASEVSSKSAENLECGVCEVHPIQEESLSPCLPRHRTNSFLSAIVRSGNHMLDVNDCYKITNYPSENFPEHGNTYQSTTQGRRVVKIAQEEHKDEKIKESALKEEKSKPFSDVSAEKIRNEKDKLVKMSQRSMRRGSGAGSPNSLMSIPRYPAFDLDEQDEEHTVSSNIPCPKKTTDHSPEMTQKPAEIVNNSSPQVPSKELVPNVKENARGKQDYTKTMLMPEVMENSETESAKGSFECESSEAPSIAADPPSIPVPHIAFPNLPDTLLSKLGISKDCPMSVESFDDQDLENKFMTLSLAFKTDKLTLSKRLEIQKRQRDIAEKDAENEIKAIKDSLNYLNLNALTSETRDLIAKIQTHVDIVSLATSKISARSETYGAVKQEERVSCAFEVMMQHVENLRRLFDKEHRELEETKLMLSGTQVHPKKLSVTEGSYDEHKKSLKTFGLAIGTVKSVFSFKAILSSLQLALKVVRRRASVADFHQHSLQESFKSSRFSQTWNSESKETKSRLFSALSPFSSSTSVGLISSSLSAHVCAPIVPSSQPFNQVTGSRRCSLPASTLSGSPITSKISENRTKDTLPLNRKPSELKISVAPSLSSVADEENSEDECNQELLETPEGTTSCNDCNLNYRWKQEYPHRKDKEKDFGVEDATDSHDDRLSDTEVCDSAERNTSTLQRLAFPCMLHFWKETSTLNLFRYLISIFFGLGAFIVLVMTFLPSDNCSASDEHMYAFMQILGRFIPKTSHSHPTV